MKEKVFEMENQFLSLYAVKSQLTKGRLKAEPPCPMRTDFQRDRDRIIHSKSFRRLKNKTQVFFSPGNDHYRTRLTHTLDVSQISRSIARSLSLNEDLAEAIALGHDLGHTPFGHAGERVLNDLSPKGFKHNEQSLRVVDVLENDNQGLNLTYEVRDGILNHTKSGNPSTLEAKAVSIADRIAYVNHDIDDAIRAGLLKQDDLPSGAIKLLGSTSRERINSLIMSIYNGSFGKPFVALEQDKLSALEELRDFMFGAVYLTPYSAAEEQKARRMLEGMYNYFLQNSQNLPAGYLQIAKISGLETAVCDYISSMSDKYAVYIFENIFIPKSWTL